MAGKSISCSQKVELNGVIPVATEQDPDLVSGALIPFPSPLSPSCPFLEGTNSLS